MKQQSCLGQLHNYLRACVVFGFAAVMQLAAILNPQGQVEQLQQVQPVPQPLQQVLQQLQQLQPVPQQLQQVLQQLQQLQPVPQQLQQMRQQQQQMQLQLQQLQLQQVPQGTTGAAAAAQLGNIPAAGANLDGADGGNEAAADNEA